MCDPGAWLIECRWGGALESGGVSGGTETEWWGLWNLGLCSLLVDLRVSVWLEILLLSNPSDIDAKESRGSSSPLKQYRALCNS